MSEHSLFCTHPKCKSKKLKFTSLGRAERHRVTQHPGWEEPRTKVLLYRYPDLTDPAYEPKGLKECFLKRAILAEQGTPQDKRAFEEALELEVMTYEQLRQGIQELINRLKILQSSL
eukprot:TRINITY_DN2942_c0_g1_i4.p1 TRINITY_DN2942_c0_g1~~TRINITY_DN2942_c0_g1_i4.p1  ORF type:complete len:117 (-),score=3.06 TRINITY_DN2942_c0_g1_i4:23-373(-)